MSSPALPSGTVTFLFTDIEGSTKLLQQLGETYASVRADHHRLLRQAFADHEGVEVDTAGNSFFVAFPLAPEAVAAAAAGTRALAEHPWPDGTALRVRMGLHTGTGTLYDGHYIGLDVHQAARIAAAGHGGQILLSASTRELVTHRLPEGATLRDLGTYQLKDLPQPERLFQLVVPGLAADFPRLKTLDRPPHHLPPRVPGFLGRAEDQRALIAALLIGQSIAVVGMGGLGKSSLAAEAVHTVASDGAPGLLRAVSEVWPTSLRIRCWAHKMRRVLAKVPEEAQAEGKAFLETVRDAPTPEVGRRAAEDVLAR
jgi:class 3 adenylate cyclase